MSPESDDGVLARLIEQLDGAPAAGMVDVAFMVLRRYLPLRALWLYMADYSEDELRLVPVSASPQPPSDTLAIRGTVAGRTYFNRQLVEAEGEDGPVVWAPVFRRSDSVGVLGMRLDAHDPRVTVLAPVVAHIVGGAVLAARRHSDVFELARGAQHLRLAAAMQWDLLPMPTYAEPGVEVAGRVEPAYDIGGDAFDFAANDGEMELAVLDAMGHGLRATLLTALAVGAYRHGRRRHAGLTAVAREVDEAVRLHSEEEAYVTGHLCRLDLTAGLLSWVNAGHPVPLLIRDHSAELLGQPEPMLPFGLEGYPDEEVRITLQPEDIVLFYSDGVIEARTKTGASFGMERFLDMAGRHGDKEVPLLVLVRQILDAVLEHAEQSLRDDATLVALRWTGGDQSRRPGGPGT